MRALKGFLCFVKSSKILSEVQLYSHDNMSQQLNFSLSAQLGNLSSTKCSSNYVYMHVEALGQVGRYWEFF